ncbi:flavodoxin family protein [Methanoplanus endosymbiosus]|uniref:Flavodoxin family protein n=1 Tax=Methanoplanus endosymbiosus TaxID=33865 RepID=A0A9E7TGN5_9EURY|nr:flavodoxin family protein [Methanoplanus endosymbiosus]UUX91467.1 flavodoxin family protein [Methanoplanus endosymbiosus]
MVISVLAFAGSPRRHGNSETLLDYLLNSLQADEEVVIEKYALSDVDVKPCRGCNVCEKKGECVIKDDFGTLAGKIESVDIIVLSAPVYCLGLCAQAKALIDRMQVFRSRKYVLGMEIVPPEKRGKKTGVFISTAGQDWDWVFDAVIPTVKCFYHLAGVKNRDVEYLMVNNVDAKGAVQAHPDAVRLAEESAAAVLKKVRMLRSGE